MTLFQILTIPIIALLLFRSLGRLLKGAHPRGLLLLEVFIWTAAGVAIFDPDLTIRIARILDIGRGADLILYLVAICFFLSALFFYNRMPRIESQITTSLRHLAFTEAQRPAEDLNGRTMHKGVQGMPSVAGNEKS